MAARRDLRIGQGLTLPIHWMTMSSVVYGTRGSGKSTLGRKLAEEVANQAQRFCAIDPTGAWWGLKSTESGTDVGLPVVIFGGDHADVPLEPGAGALIADVVAGIEQSTILDLEHLSKGKQIRFLGDFLARLYHVNREPLLLLMDEAQRYAPQKPMGPDAQVTLGAAEDIVKLGRKHGIGPVVFTQRGSGLNKEVSELADVLIAFRTPGVLDQSRIKDWLEANATAEQMKEVMSTISGLPTGTAIFASNHPDLRVFTTVAIDRPGSFDSSATPQVGQRRREPRILAKPDLEALREKMAGAIERAKAEDPKELRKQITELKRELATRPTEVVEKIVTEKIEVPVMSDKDRRAVEELVEQLALVRDQTSEAVDLVVVRLREVDQGNRDSIAAEIKAGRRMERAAPRPAPDPPRRVVTATYSDMAPLGKAEKQILAVLQQHTEGLTRTQLAFLTGYSPRTSTLGVALGRLRRDGLVMKDAHDLTEQGHRYDVGEVDMLPPPGPELAAYWMNRLGKAEREILRVMLEAHPGELTRAEIAERTGYSPLTSTLGVAFGKLRGLKLIEGFRVSEALVGR
jgi:hypothetical protein